MRLTFKPDGSFKGTIISAKDKHEEERVGGEYHIEGTHVVVEDLDEEWAYHVDKDSLLLTPTEDSDDGATPITLKRIAGPGPVPPPPTSRPGDVKSVLDHIHGKLKRFAVDKPADEAAMDEELFPFNYSNADVEKAYALGTAANAILRTWIVSPRAVYREFALRALSAINGKRSTWLNVQMLTNEKPGVRWRAMLDLNALFPDGPVQERAYHGDTAEDAITYVRQQGAMEKWLRQNHPELMLDLITDGGPTAPRNEIEKILYR